MMSTLAAQQNKVVWVFFKGRLLKSVIHDATSWTQHIVCEVGSKKLDATLGDTRQEF